MFKKKSNVLGWHTLVQDKGKRLINKQEKFFHYSVLAYVMLLKRVFYDVFMWWSFLSPELDIKPFPCKYLRACNNTTFSVSFFIKWNIIIHWAFFFKHTLIDQLVNFKARTLTDLASIHKSHSCIHILLLYGELF